MDRRARDELGIPTLCLMENAGAGAARIALEMASGRAGAVVCVCGPGGNGGDALVVARHLAIAGTRVSIVLSATPSRGDPGVQHAICAALRLPMTRIVDGDGASGLFDARDRPAIVVDGLYGTGLSRPLTGLDAALVHAMNAAGVPVLSLDLPSGLDCDTGSPLGPCVRAAVTATFVAPKLGFLHPASRDFTGEVRVVAIGAPAEWSPRL